jgi:hypothetical protein
MRNKKERRSILRQPFEGEGFGILNTLRYGFSFRGATALFGIDLKVSKRLYNQKGGYSDRWQLASTKKRSLATGDDDRLAITNKALRELSQVNGLLIGDWIKPCLQLVHQLIQKIARSVESSECDKHF